VHHIAGGLVIRKQRNHREQRLNFFADPLEIQVFLTQEHLRESFMVPSETWAQFRTRSASAICGKLSIAQGWYQFWASSPKCVLQQLFSKNSCIK
jgi:hypothetical protein